MGAWQVSADVLAASRFVTSQLIETVKALGVLAARNPQPWDGRLASGIRGRAVFRLWQRGNARGVLLWKLEGLSDYDIRRPMTPTGTNLLGLVKHCAADESWYLGEVVGRPFPGEADLDWHAHR
jgi:hypothetical protein